MHLWGKGTCWGNLREIDHLEDPDVSGRRILRWIFRNLDMRALIESSRFRTRRGGEHL